MLCNEKVLAYLCSAWSITYVGTAVPTLLCGDVNAVDVEVDVDVDLDVESKI